MKADATPSPVADEKRRMHRFPLRLPMFLQTMEGEAFSMQATSIDLNSMGMQIETQGNLDATHSVGLCFQDVAPGASSMIKGEVRWTKKKNAVRVGGIAFKERVDWSHVLSRLIRAARHTPARDFSNHSRASEKNLSEDQTKSMILGKITKDLLDDLLNPLCSAAGRLDLLSLKMNRAAPSVGTSHMAGWIIDIETVQHTIDQMTVLCRAASRRRHFGGLSVSKDFFSLNDLIEAELTALNLHTGFRKIRQCLELSPNLSTLWGHYADWANVFVILCETFLRQMRSLEHPQIFISTEMDDEHIILSFNHNGKALTPPLDAYPYLTILGYIRKMYHVEWGLSGVSGGQTLTLRIPRMQKNGSATGTGT